MRAKRVEIYRGLSPEGYYTVLIRGVQDCMAPLALPDIMFVLAEMGWS